MDPKIYEKYENFYSDSIIDNNPFYLFCTGKNCEKILKFYQPVKSLGQINLKCECLNYFCSMCKKDAHRPIKCSLYDKWIKF